MHSSFANGLPPDRGRGFARHSADTFAREGVVAWLDECDRERFNFVQRVWLAPAVAMGSRSAREREALGVNVLTRLIPARNVRAAVGVTSREALRLTPVFVAECLPVRDADCPDWSMPLPTLRAWLASVRAPAPSRFSL